MVLGRQQLFTENTLTAVLPLLKNRDWKTFANVCRLWCAVLVANLFGAAAFALVAAHTETFERLHMQLTQLGIEAVSHSFREVVIRGIYGGWLIALMVWLMPFSESAKVFVIIIISYLVGLGEFSHVIAGSVEVFICAFLGKCSWFTAVTGYVLPSLIGNIIGGVTLVAALNHSQIVSGIPMRHNTRVS